MSRVYARAFRDKNIACCKVYARLANGVVKFRRGVDGDGVTAAGDVFLDDNGVCTFGNWPARKNPYGLTRFYLAVISRSCRGFSDDG